jgi:type IV fimbrial biogenesis protein FimT
MLKFSRGATLIELMVGVVILAILTTIAVPSFSQWVKNMRIRTVAEAVLSGLTLARTEALNRNTAMRFQLTDTVDGDCALSASGPHWVVSRDDAEGMCGAAPSDTETPRIVQIHDGTQGSGDKAKIAAGQNLFTFNGLGRLITPAADILVSDAEGGEKCVSDGGKARCLRIQITTGGGIRMCDPALPATDTQGCI